MTNYYKELGLDRNKRIDEINADLSKLESTWKRREITNPERATTMLALIIQARKVFASDSARRTYDNDLDKSLKQPEQIDPNLERRESLKKWRDQASSYYVSGQFDLAKVAIEKAISLSNVNGDDDSLFALAANIYKDNGDLQTAMSYINRAIVTAPEVSAYYLSKGLIYDQQASVAMQKRGCGNPEDYHIEARKMFQMAEVKADQNGDLANRARACGALAFSYYYQDPVDKQEGEDFANLAVKFGGDSWGNADKVLNEVNAIREEKRRKEQEEENARRIKLYTEAMDLSNERNIYSIERAINIFKTLEGWNKSNDLIKECELKIETINQENENIEREKELQLEEEKKKRKVRNRIILVVFFMGIVAVFICILKNNIEKNNKIKNKYEEAVELYKTEKYTEAIDAFLELGDYGDSKEYVANATDKYREQKYNKAIGMLEGGNYEEAYSMFSDLENYKDSRQYLNETLYLEAEDCLENGDYYYARSLYEELGKYKNSEDKMLQVDQMIIDETLVYAEEIYKEGYIFDAAIYCYNNSDYPEIREKCFEYWSEITDQKTIAAGGNHSDEFSLGVKSDGTVIAIGNDDYMQCKVSDWKNIIAVSAGYNHSVGLRADGTVVATGNNDYGQCNVGGWKDIVSIEAGENITYGLVADGTIVSTSEKVYSEDEWYDIVTINSGRKELIGCRADGRIVIDASYEQSEIDKWENVVKAAKGDDIYGLCSNGTVVSTDSYDSYIEGWRSIVDITYASLNVVGLTSKGTIVATDSRRESLFSSWNRIVCIDGGTYHVIGLRSDGTAVAVGNNLSGDCNVEDWSDLKIPHKYE